MPNNSKTLHKETGFFLHALPAGMERPEDGDWVVMSAELPADLDGDIVRIAGMEVPKEMPLLAQHMRRNYADASPTVIGKVVESKTSEIVHEGKKCPAKLGRFVWAPSDLAGKYKQLWPEFMNKVSIGARIKEWQPRDPKEPFGPSDYTKTELFELSIVTIPANPAAGVMRAIKDTLGDDFPEFREFNLSETQSDWIEMLDERLGPYLKSMDERFESLRDFVESALVAQSKGAHVPPTDDRKELADKAKEVKDFIDSIMRR